MKQEVHGNVKVHKQVEVSNSADVNTIGSLNEA